MRVEKKEEPYVLHDGDTITCNVTHEIKIGGEKSWVGYTVTRKISSTVPANEAAQRLQEHVDAQVINNIQQTVATVRKQS